MFANQGAESEAHDNSYIAEHSRHNKYPKVTLFLMFAYDFKFPL